MSEEFYYTPDDELLEPDHRYKEWNIHMDILHDAIHRLREYSAIAGHWDDVGMFDRLLELLHDGRMQYEDVVDTIRTQLLRQNQGRGGNIISNLFHRFSPNGLGEDMGLPADEMEDAS